MNLINRLVYRLASYWLTNTDLANIKATREYIERQKERKIRDEAGYEMSEYLKLMGRDFQLDLEQQDHIAYMLGNPLDDKPKPLTLQELRYKKGR